MKPLTRSKEARWIFLSAMIVVGTTALVGRQVDFSDMGVFVIWAIFMLLLTAAVRHYFVTSTDEDGRSELEQNFKFFQRIFPPEDSAIPRGSRAP